MNRIDRISAILIQLQSHSLVKAQQISERFEISIRTVYRDIRTLEEAGIPIIGNPGIGYSLAEGFKLPPLMFTQKEALSFLIAEKLVHELTDSNSNEHYKSGIEKIKSVMRFVDKKMLETMEECLSILNTYKSSAYKPDILLLILQSIYQKRIVEMSYFTGTTLSVSERKVEPIGIFFSRTNWYLIGFCLQKEAYLTFRIDRIQEIHILNEFQSREHPPFKKFLDEFYDKEKLYEVVIRIEKDKTSMINDDKYYYGLTSEKEIDNMIEYRFITFSISKFAHWYLSFADVATIITPNSLKHEVKNIINNISI
ncbi:YafY family protein [Bacteroides fragilis]|uniref:helix-turn-helix transcriptional regulator n=1 Tax=Bacteroides fragilis TaxID=817 RepID=UPI001C7CDEA5|nr:YafY family protein [Bacteroides fragilis]